MTSTASFSHSASSPNGGLWWRRWLRRLAKGLAARVPAVHDLLMRAPFSRRAHLVPVLFGGTEVLEWRGLVIEVEVGEYEGFYRYFAGTGPEPEIDWLETQCAGSQVLFDIGANQGFVALAVARACPGLRVVAFEPDPVNAARFRRNIGWNPALADRIDIVELAAGAATGMASFETAGGMNSGTGKVAAGGSGGRQVRVTTVADYCEAHGVRPDVIKIDVEGAEADVLSGLGPVAATLSGLVVEIHHDQPTSPERAAFVQRLQAHFARLPLTFRYLVDERDWRERAPEPWPKRFHAFGVRTSSRA